jgi:hypothetical protein
VGCAGGVHERLFVEPGALDHQRIALEVADHRSPGDPWKPPAGSLGPQGVESVDSVMPGACLQGP